MATTDDDAPPPPQVVTIAPGVTVVVKPPVAAGGEINTPNVAAAPTVATFKALPSERVNVSQKKPTPPRADDE